MWNPFRTPDEVRTVAIIGGTGAFGSLIAQALPPHIHLLTVSRNSELPLTERYTAIHADVLTTPAEAVLEQIVAHTPTLDVLVYAPFFSYFKPLAHMTRAEIEYEYTLIGLLPILYVEAYTAYVARAKTTHTHTFIHVGSGAYRGIPSGRPDLGSYSAAKAYAHRGIEALASHTDALGMRLVELNPGSLRDSAIAAKTVSLFWNEATQTNAPYYASHLIV